MVVVIGIGDTVAVVRPKYMAKVPAEAVILSSSKPSKDNVKGPVPIWVLVIGHRMLP
jgi:hypothetical protein